MTNSEFRHWINGYLVLSDEEYLDNKQICIIKNHANLVQQMAGNLDADITNFIFQLESNIQDNSQIDILTFKNIAENNLRNFVNEK